MATANMGLTKPTEGGSSGVWDTLINAMIDLIDAHDHSTGKGVTVKPAGIAINANLPFGNYRSTGMTSVGFTSVASGTLLSSGGTYTNHLGVVANELTFINSSGTAIQLTSGSSLNTALVGGITGDYSTTDANCTYSDSLKAYKFLQDETPDFYADVRCARVDLFEKTSGISNYVRLSSPSSLSASYTVTWPGAVPGSTSVVTMTSAGVLATTRDVSVDNVTAGTKITTDAFAHGIRYCVLPASAGISNGGGWSYNPSRPGTALDYWDAPNINEIVSFPIPLKEGDRLLSVRVYLQDTSGGTPLDTIAYEVGVIDVFNETDTKVGDTMTSAGDGTYQGLALTGLGTGYTVSGSGYLGLYVAVYAVTATTTNHQVYAVRYSYDRP